MYDSIESPRICRYQKKTKLTYRNVMFSLTYWRPSPIQKHAFNHSSTRCRFVQAYLFLSLSLCTHLLKEKRKWILSFSVFFLLLFLNKIFTVALVILGYNNNKQWYLNDTSCEIILPLKVGTHSFANNLINHIRLSWMIKNKQALPFDVML